jgi:hypothetical protein
VPNVAPEGGYLRRELHPLAALRLRRVAHRHCVSPIVLEVLPELIAEQIDLRLLRAQAVPVRALDALEPLEFRLLRLYREVRAEDLPFLENFVTNECGNGCAVSVEVR